MNRKIAGVDVSRGSITVAILAELPSQRLKDFVKSCKVQKFKSAEVEEFLQLDFDGAVLEPTGGHYSKFWAEKIRAAGKEVRWVGHREVHGYRESWRLPDKTDKTDSIALACYGLERWDMPGMFLDERVALTIELREKFLQLQFLIKSANPLINRLRQQLHHECPELAEKGFDRAWMATPPGVIAAIGGEPTARWKKVIDNSVGLGIGAFSRELAGQLAGQQRLQQRIETELELLLRTRPAFEPYLRAMEPFHFGRRGEIALLSTIYPFERFSDRPNPIGSFKLACGMAQVWVESGDFKGWVAGGDVYLRKALWLWAFTIIPQTPEKCRGFVTSPELEALRDYYRNGSTQLVKGKDGEMIEQHFDPGKGSQKLMRVCRRALTMLFRRLKAEIPSR